MTGTLRVAPVTASDTVAVCLVVDPGSVPNAMRDSSLVTVTVAVAPASLA